MGAEIWAMCKPLDGTGQRNSEKGTKQKDSKAPKTVRLIRPDREIKNMGKEPVYVQLGEHPSSVIVKLMPG
ncbi:MAG: hypothetical protein GWN86_07095, partial [Desulfobacterales bacterium]|nr:hypothetical protein [Desulfobacterales bacterium]